MRAQRQQRASYPTEKLRGEVLEFTVRGSEGWGTGIIRTTQNGGERAIVGKLFAKPGDTVDLVGWFETGKYGEQFKFSSCQVVVPNDASGVIGWLSARLPQVSRRRAELLVQTYGVEGLWEVMDGRQVDKLCAIDGITPDRAKVILDAYHRHKAERDLMTWFKAVGLTDNQVANVVVAFGKWSDKPAHDFETKEERETRFVEALGLAKQRILERPYDLAKHVHGFGWSRADDCARRIGIPLNHPARIEAGLLHYMSEATGVGHCMAPMGKLVGVTAQKILGGIAEDEVRTVLHRMLDDGELVARGPNVYTGKLAGAEGRVAAAFIERSQRGAAA